MPDREKVIERLEKLSFYFKSMLQIGYSGDADIYREHRETVKMTIALLKDQEPVEPMIKTSHDGKGSWWYICGSCNTAVNLKDKYCRECGRELKWE